MTRSLAFSFQVPQISRECSAYRRAAITPSSGEAGAGGLELRVFGATAPDYSDAELRQAKASNRFFSLDGGSNWHSQAYVPQGAARKTEGAPNDDGPAVAWAFSG